MQRNKMRIRTEYQRLFGRIINIIYLFEFPWGSILTSGIGSRRHRRREDIVMPNIPVLTAVGAAIAAGEEEKDSVPLPGGRKVKWTLTNRLEWRRRNAFVKKVLHQLWICEETGERTWRPIPHG